MKKQRDTVTREIAVNPYDIEALEGWLEELAAQEGLRLKRCGPGYFVFRRGEPACLRRQLQDRVPLEQRRPDGTRHVTSARVRRIVRLALLLPSLLLILYVCLRGKGLV